MPDPVPSDEVPPPAPRRRWYLRDLQVALVGALLAICAATGVAGWWLHPSSNGFQPVPQDLTIVTSGSQFDLTETLTPTGGGGATLEVEEPHALGDGHPLDTDKWLVESGGVLEAFGPLAQLNGKPLRNNSWEYIVLYPGLAHPCPSLSNYKSGNVDLPWIKGSVPAIVVKANRPQAITEDHPNLVVCLRWTKAGPIRIKGSYMTARFPPVHGTAVSGSGADSVAIIQFGDDRDLAAGQLNRVVDLQGSNTSNFNLQSDPRPAVTKERSWTWTTKDSPQVIQVAAVDTTDAQRENNNALYSGILFGLSGAAAIALITELVRPLSRAEAAD